MVVMAVITTAKALWCGAIAWSAPWFLQGVRAGAKASALDPQLSVTIVLILVASVFAGYGATRTARSWTELKPA
jgi:membrane protein DedA with SNARE-associated domain